MATHWHLTVVRVRGREFYLVKSFHRNKLLIWSGIAWEYVPIKINQRKLSWFESLPFAFLSLFFFFFWLFLISSFFYKVYQEAVAFMYWTQFPGPTSLHIEPVLDINRSIGMDFTHSTNNPIIIMTWVTWKLSEIEDSCGVVIWHVRAHSTFKWRSSLLIINRPVGICARVVFYAIYGGDEITHDAVVRAFVFVKRALFLAVSSFVHDVNQKSSFGNLCSIILWNRFINDGDIPFKLKGDCDLQGMNSHEYVLKQFSISYRNYLLWGSYQTCTIFCSWEVVDSQWFCLLFYFIALAFVDNTHKCIIGYCLTTCEAWDHKSMINEGLRG